MVKSLSLALSHVLADRTAVAKYLQNIYFEGEPAKNRTCAEMALVQNYGFTINDKPRQAIAHEIGLHRISSDEKQKNITSGDNSSRRLGI